ncbi:MAG: TIGR01548 family HAD-type hydrolase [Phycisphaeraceae bacterium]|nr:TIGR01548 family HAD-type hydrolase [Phycisphaeraceae bacterium]
MAQAERIRIAPPLPISRRTRAQIAARHNVTADRVIVTAGADDALERITRAVLSPGREAILTTPTFEMLSRYARLAGADVIEAQWLGEPFDVEAIESRIGPRTAAIFIVTPNNPTGQAIPAESIRRLSAAIPAGLLVVDLAYAEFADEDLTELVLSLPNAVAVRTFSKAWGLAGLRRLRHRTRRSDQLAPPSGTPTPSAAPRSRSLPRGGRSRQKPRRSRSTPRPPRTPRTHRAPPRPRRRAHRVTGQLRPRSLRSLLLRLDPERTPRLRSACLTGDQRPTLPSGSVLEPYLRITLPGEPVAFNRLCTALTSALRPRAILFDMDGVLADVSGSYRQAIVRTAAAFGVNLSAPDIARAKDAGNANNDWVLTRRLLLARGVDVPLEDVIRTFESFYQGDPDNAARARALADRILLIERARLEALARRFTLAIVTGRPRRDAERFLSHFGITDLFPVVVTMEDAPPKPDPRPITIALERLGERAAWMIGDTPDDLIAARRAGVPSIGVLAPGDRATEERAFEAGRTLVNAGAARVLASVTELTEVLP